MANFKHESKAPLTGSSPESADTSFVSELESIYCRYGGGIYTICLRLIADEKAAEAATVDAFVKFSREMASYSGESRVRLRLCELAVNASLTRLNHRGRTVVRRLRRSLGV